MILKGAIDAIGAGLDGAMPAEVTAQADAIADLGATPLAIRRDGQVLGLIELKDTVKEGLVERFEEFRRMGIRTVMITGDNPRTAATIAREAGVDDFIAEATPEDKIAFIRKEQADGHLVAMTGDGTNDAPAVAQADVGPGHEQRHVGVQGGGQHGRPRLRPDEAAGGHRHRQAAAHHARLDHDVQHRQRRGQVLRHHPGAVRGHLPGSSTSSTSCGSPTAQSAILSAVIFNALIIPALIPLALRGVSFKPAPASELLRRNLLVYGLGGIIAPFVGIKLIDIVVSALGLA